MIPFDDNDLIDRLQSGIAERQSGVSAPDGIGDEARRAARKRIAARAVRAGVPLLAAAGVATVLATSAGSGSTAARGPRAGGSALSAPTGSVKLEDTAYIVKRVKANLAESTRDRPVIHAAGYASGNVGADGSLVNLGWKLADVYDYTAPDGTEYSRELMHQHDGSPYLTMTDHFSPDGNGTVNDAQTIINPHNDTYSQTRYRGLADPHAGAATPNLYSSPSEVQHALRSGQVTQQGTATVKGTQALALSITVPSVPNVSSASLTLYVDAQTFQPLRTVTVYNGLSDLEVADWVPATADNVAQSESDSIPAGYTKVDKARVFR